MEKRAFSLTWPASRCKFIATKESFYGRKEFKFPEDWFRIPTWRPFHCFGTPIWPLRCPVKTLYRT